MTHKTDADLAKMTRGELRKLLDKVYLEYCDSETTPEKKQELIGYSSRIHQALSNPARRR